MAAPLSQPLLAIVLAGLSLLGTLYIEFSHNDREIAAAISALQTHQADETRRLDRIENKLDKLVTWALGKP
jgi:hypothetical protein